MRRRRGAWIGLVVCATALLPVVAADLDPKEIRDTVEKLATVVDREYFDPELAARVAAALREHLAQGAFADAPDLEALAETVTRDMETITHDKHLVATVVVPVPKDAPDDGSREARGRRSNFGVRRVEILAGNVGYLDLTAFYRPGEAADALAAAMRLLRHADALILDSRDNGGGNTETVALFASYLFDQPGLPLFEVVPRPGSASEPHRHATSKPLPAEHDGKRPIWVLTSSKTFSGGEGIAFLLQDRRRAEVVGERTPGAANPGRPYPVTEHIEVTVPNGRIRAAVGGGNWEGIGVTPDVAVAASDALRTAHARALRALLKTTPAGAWRETLQKELEALEPAGR